MNNKLTDLELCRRIAEIEGVTVDAIDGEYLGIHGKYDIEEYNPLTNKALLFDLMVKHAVEVHYDYSNCVAYRDGREVGLVRFDIGSELPRAILECIVESKSNQNK